MAPTRRRWTDATQPLGPGRHKTCEGGENRRTSKGVTPPMPAPGYGVRPCWPRRYRAGPYRTHPPGQAGKGVIGGSRVETLCSGRGFDRRGETTSEHSFEKFRAREHWLGRLLLKHRFRWLHHTRVLVRQPGFDDDLPPFLMQRYGNRIGLNLHVKCARHRFGPACKTNCSGPSHRRNRCQFVFRHCRAVWPPPRRLCWQRLGGQKHPRRSRCTAR